MLACGAALRGRKLLRARVRFVNAPHHPRVPDVIHEASRRLVVAPLGSGLGRQAAELGAILLEHLHPVRRLGIAAEPGRIAA